MNAPRLVWIFANPGSGAGPNRARVDALVRALEARGFLAECKWEIPAAALPGGCVGAPIASDRAPASSSTVPAAIVAAGGDGTVNRVINLAIPAPLAVYPLGTQNLVARKFGFTTDAVRLADRIAAGKTSPTDIARAGNRRFLLMASAGFDAEVVACVDRWRNACATPRRVRNITYARPITGAFFRYSYPALRLQAGAEEIEGVLAMVFNLAAYALMLPILPASRADDGELDWLVFRRPGKIPLCSLFIDILRGKHLRRSDVVHGRARSLRIVAAGDRPVPLQVDGDAAGTTPVEISVTPRALQIYVA